MNTAQAEEALRNAAKILGLSIPSTGVICAYTRTHSIEIGVGPLHHSGEKVVYLSKEPRPGTWRAGGRCPRNIFVYNPKPATFKKLAVEIAQNNS